MSGINQKDPKVSNIVSRLETFGNEKDLYVRIQKIESSLLNIIRQNETKIKKLEKRIEKLEKGQ